MSTSQLHVSTSLGLTQQRHPRSPNPAPPCGLSPLLVASPAPPRPHHPVWFDAWMGRTSLMMQKINKPPTNKKHVSFSHTCTANETLCMSSHSRVYYCWGLPSPSEGCAVLATAPAGTEVTAHRPHLRHGAVGEDTRAHPWNLCLAITRASQNLGSHFSMDTPPPPGMFPRGTCARLRVDWRLRVDTWAEPRLVRANSTALWGGKFTFFPPLHVSLWWWYPSSETSCPSIHFI